MYTCCCSPHVQCVWCAAIQGERGWWWTEHSDLWSIDWPCLQVVRWVHVLFDTTMKFGLSKAQFISWYLLSIVSLTMSKSCSVLCAVTVSKSSSVYYVVYSWLEAMCTIRRHRSGLGSGLYHADEQRQNTGDGSPAQVLIIWHTLVHVLCAVRSLRCTVLLCLLYLQCLLEYLGLLLTPCGACVFCAVVYCDGWQQQVKFIVKKISNIQTACITYYMRSCKVRGFIYFVIFEQHNPFSYLLLFMYPIKVEWQDTIGS